MYLVRKVVMRTLSTDVEGGFFPIVPEKVEQIKLTQNLSKKSAGVSKRKVRSRSPSPDKLALQSSSIAHRNRNRVVFLLFSAFDTAGFSHC